MMEWSWKHTELRDPLGPLHLCSSMFLLSEDTDVFKSSGGVMHLNSATLLSQRKGVHSEVTGGGGGAIHWQASCVWACPRSSPPSLLLCSLSPVFSGGVVDSACAVLLHHQTLWRVGDLLWPSADLLHSTSVQ